MLLQIFLSFLFQRLQRQLYQVVRFQIQRRNIFRFCSTQSDYPLVIPQSSVDLSVAFMWSSSSNEIKKISLNIPMHFLWFSSCSKVLLSATVFSLLIDSEGKVCSSSLCLVLVGFCFCVILHDAGINRAFSASAAASQRPLHCFSIKRKDGHVSFSINWRGTQFWIRCLTLIVWQSALRLRRPFIETSSPKSSHAV